MPTQAQTESLSPCWGPGGAARELGRTALATPLGLCSGFLPTLPQQSQRSPDYIGLDLRSRPFGSPVGGSLRVADDFPVGGFTPETKEGEAKETARWWIELGPALRGSSGRSVVAWCGQGWVGPDTPGQFCIFSGLNRDFAAASTP